MVDKEASDFVAESYWPGVSEQVVRAVDERCAATTYRAQGGTST